jgi:hypothetical protein
MRQRGLEWGYRLRADLEARIGNLRAALADMEPLRDELARLEGQLRGVERLIEVYHTQLGYPRPPWAEEAAATVAPAPAALPGAIPAKPGAPDILSGATKTPPAGSAWRVGLLKAANGSWAAAVGAWLAARTWIGRRLPPHRAQS